MKGPISTLRKFIHGTWQFFNVLLMAIAPLAFIGFVVALIALPSGWGEHRQFVRRLDEFGQVTEGVVTSTSPENNWVFVDYVDNAGKERYGVIDMFYYTDDALWQTLKPETKVTLRYLPWHVPNNDRVILAEYYADVRDYRGYFSPDLVGLLLVCWGLVILNPYFLYFGLVDAEKLSIGGLPQ